MATAEYGSCGRTNLLISTPFSAYEADFQPKSDHRRLVHWGDFPILTFPRTGGKGTEVSIPHRVPVSYGSI